MSLDSSKLRTAIESITDLPTLPTVVATISTKVANPMTNAADVGRLIEQDPALTSKVLRLVNSAYYGFPKQIKSIQHAVVILGFNKVKAIIITATVFDIIEQKDGRQLNLRRFWQHSLGVAIASKAVAETIGASHSGEDAFIGGLLHDIGKVILDQFQHDLYGPVLQYAGDKDMLLLDAEKELMGVTHSQVGGWIIDKWRLPSSILQMVKYHHTPSQASERRELVNSVHLGDFIAKGLGVGNGGDDKMPPLHQSVVSQYSIDPAFMEKCVDRTLKELARAEDFFELVSEK